MQISNLLRLLNDQHWRFTFGVIAVVATSGYCLAARSVISFWGLVQFGLIEPKICGILSTPTMLVQPPKLVTGRVSFYAVALRKGESNPAASVALNDPTQVFPTASIVKTLVLHQVLRAVDEGRLSLQKKFTTTAENRSIEAYPKGSNGLVDLAKLAIRRSDNTASDIIHLAVGPTAVAQAVKTKGPCTNLLVTTKALWAAQAGLSSSVLGTDLLAGAEQYANASFEDRLKVAAELIAVSKKVTGPNVEAALDKYFHGPIYTPSLELWLQNTTTAQDFTNLLLKTLPGLDLKPSTRNLFRSIMTTGCCISKTSPLPAVYRAAKAGSGWRILTLTGYIEMASGLTLAYTYLNDQSDTLDAEEMEKQIRPVNVWIDQVLLDLIRRAK
jgi:beta-lactamase class A